MGWANDFYEYVMTDPLFRKYKHTALNFPLMYAYTENYVLPISHDEVVHGKLSFIDKMHGSYEDKFAQMRTSLLLMMTYPGKKMLFMGTEYGQFREWDYENSLEWFMLDYPKHKQMREFVAALNAFYLENSELWELDFSESGFEWILADESEKNLVAFRRKNIKGNNIIVVLSFSGCDQKITIPVKYSALEKIFDSGNVGDAENIVAVRKRGKQYYADITVPGFSGIIFREKRTKNIKAIKEN